MVTDKSDPFASLDSLEGLPGGATGIKPWSSAFLRLVLPGLLIALIIALAAGFLSQNYGGPVMLFALLLGMAFHFLSIHARTAAGIDFAARTVLRVGVALLGVRITLEKVVQLGWWPVAIVVIAVVVTTLSGIVLARLLRLERDHALLSGGAVAICGASAALALSSVMPRSGSLERNTILTVVGVTTLSTLAMILYPLFAVALGMTDREAGIFLGGTIHDVAQVIGAGYTVSDEAGDISTIIKLLRVAMLLPVVMAFTLFLHRKTPQSDASKPALLPWFLIVFVVLVGMNSVGWIPDPAQHLASETSRWCLITAIAALGMKTSFEKLYVVGWRPVLLMVLQTLLMAGIFMAALISGILSG